MSVTSCERCPMSKPPTPLSREDHISLKEDHESQIREQIKEDIEKTKEEQKINLKSDFTMIVFNLLDDTPEITTVYRVGKIKQVTVRLRSIKVAFSSKGAAMTLTKKFAIRNRTNKLPTSLIGIQIKSDQMKLQ